MTRLLEAGLQPHDELHRLLVDLTVPRKLRIRSRFRFRDAPWARHHPFLLRRRPAIRRP